VSSVRFDGVPYSLVAGETVLDGLLRHGVRLSFSCKAGVCGSCVMKATAGLPPAKAQAGLKDSWKARGYFLACSCVPESDLEVAPPDADLRFGATIRSVRRLSDDVAEVRLTPDSSIEFRSGQYVTIVRADGLARSYSIASLPEEGELELHVRKIPNGAMSGWFHDVARAGDRVTVIGPTGECFYVSGKEDQPLLLAGTGTGLAPLYGILRDAIRQKHRGPIHLFHGALHKGGLYLVKELQEIARNHAHVCYVPAVLRGEAESGFVVGALDQAILERIPNTGGWRGYVCGDPGLVQNLKMKLFLAGMASRDIHADAFIPAAAPPPTTCS
jgi:CDP-4-dehydro-6-deoxyglucose reductase, E3